MEMVSHLAALSRMTALGTRTVRVMGKEIRVPSDGPGPFATMYDWPDCHEVCPQGEQVEPTGESGGEKE